MMCACCSATKGSVVCAARASGCEVDDLPAEFARLSAQRVAFTKPPTPAGPVMLAVFADTCGNLIQLYQRT